MADLYKILATAPRITLRKFYRENHKINACVVVTDACGSVRFCAVPVTEITQEREEKESTKEKEEKETKDLKAYIKDFVPPAPPSIPTQPKKVFQKPSVDDVRRYCLSRKSVVDPSAFWDFYEARGWMVGKYVMKSWQAAVRTWERRPNSPAHFSYSQPQGVFVNGRPKDDIDRLFELG